MKKTIVLVVAFGALARLSAQDAPGVTTDLAYASEYVFRGIQHADDSMQPSMEISYSDAYLGVWMDQPFKSREDNEIDVYAGYRHKLSRDFSLEAVATYYGYPQAREFRTRHTYEVGVGASYTYRGVAATVYYYRDFRLNSNTEQASIAYSIPLEKWGTSMDFNGFAGTVQSADWRPDAPTTAKEAYNYYGVDVSLPYKVSARTSVTAGVHWAHNHGLPSTFTDDHLWWTLGVMTGF